MFTYHGKLHQDNMKPRYVDNEWFKNKLKPVYVEHTIPLEYIKTCEC